MVLPRSGTGVSVLIATGSSCDSQFHFSISHAISW